MVNGCEEIHVQPNWCEKVSGDLLPFPASGPMLTKFAAEYLERRSPSWKPSTMKATLSYLKSVILPVALVIVARSEREENLLVHGLERPSSTSSTGLFQINQKLLCFFTSRTPALFGVTRYCDGGHNPA